MAWSKLNPKEPETIYTSPADNCDDISNDLSIVVRRMIASLTADQAEKAARLLLYTNATNGWIKLLMFDDSDNQVGGREFHLELPALFEAADNHENGSSHFDNECHIGICIMTEMLIFDELNDAYEVYTQTELKEPERLYV